MGIHSRYGRLVVSSFLLAAAATSANAQSTLALELMPKAPQSTGVQLYGLVDSALGYVSNEGGHASWSMIGGGGDRPNRWGIRGLEDLGDGNHALFVLEGGFNVGTGTISQNGALFGRQAYVGISNDRFGTLTLGHQYDFMVDLVGYSAPASGNGGQFSFHLGDLDRLGGERLNNAVKYRSPEYEGLQVGAMYSFGGVAGDFNENSASSFGISYAPTSTVSMGAAYTTVHNYQQALGIGTTVLGLSLVGFPPNAIYDRQTVFGAGVSYSPGKLYTAALFTQTSLELAGKSAAFRTADVGASYQILPRLVLGSALTYSWLGDIHWTNFTGGLQYFLSRRTDVYLQYAVLHASGPDVNAQLFLALPASGSSQTAVSVGMRHVF